MAAAVMVVALHSGVYPCNEVQKQKQAQGPIQQVLA
jgi:hypothetical protein